MSENNIENLQEEEIYFDYLFEHDYYNKTLQYGIMNGSNKILLIKPGLNGSLLGDNEKYYNLAKYINKKYGLTVVCTNNPQDKENDPLNDALEVIDSYCSFMNYKDYEIYYLGSSNGAVIGAINAYKYKSIKRLLLINPPLFINYHKIQHGIENFKGNKITFIFGELDPSTKYVELLDLFKMDNLSYKILEGEDHNLANSTVSIEGLVEKYLLKLNNI